MIHTLLLFASSFLAFANPAMTGGTASRGGDLCETAYYVAAENAEPIRAPRRKLARRIPKLSYTDTLAAFKQEQQQYKAKGVADENLPFVMDHGHKTKATIVLIHGISETPGGMKFLAEQYHKKGFNVVTVLLEGHGTTPEDLNKGNLAAWRPQIDRAVKQAAALGDKVVVGGYSFGATLALDAGSRLKNDVDAVSLHSPMLVPDKDTEQKVRERQLLDPTKYPKKDWTSDKADETLPGLSGFTYQRTPTRAYVAMLDAVKEIRPIWTTQEVDCPIYTAYGTADKVASPKATARFVKTQGIPSENVVIVEGGRHDDTVRISKRQAFPEEAIGNLIEKILNDP